MNGKKILKIGLWGVGIVVFLIIFVFGFLYYQWEVNPKPCVPEIPEKIGKVPSSAKWIGGCDGGHWYDIVDMNSVEKKYRIGIYYDYNGELIVEKEFYQGDSCLTHYSDEKQLYSVILDYDFFSIHIKDSDCHLMPVDNKTE